MFYFKQRQVRAVIDSASKRSFILSSTAVEMIFEKSDKEKFYHSLFGGTSIGIKEHDIFTIYISIPDGIYCSNFKALGQYIICGIIPPIVSEEYIDELKKNCISINNQALDLSKFL
ncbi:uncharacterized protein NPIL_549701 [Nephila pilipes]|uniref:Uncharacterized protein n=1 Tax=Nephila pilipes TaxID=299642 RepID=A0A8X6N308_NEPPI|nr:uncharacterized protein NPIL_549701 [Nephila pilipes]